MTLKKIAEVNLPTRWATFRLMAFESVDADRRTAAKPADTVLALVLGDIQRFPPLVRIHSQCMTGEVFHSMRCDCYEQLHLALHAITEQGAGVLVYEHQEGRGIGLMEKLRAYQLQDQGLDTIEANLRLGHAVDLRDYTLSVAVLEFLNIRSLQLMTNNPEKLHAVSSAGIEVIKRMSADVPANPHSARYLATKRDLLGHLFNPADDSPQPGHHSVRRASLPDSNSIGSNAAPASLHLIRKQESKR